MEWREFDNPEQEKARLEKVLSVNPKDAGVWYELATVHDDMGDGAKAVECCRKALEIEPDNALFWAFLFYLEHRVNDKEAFDALVRFIELDPDEGDYYTERVIDELAFGDNEFTINYIADLRKEGKEDVAHTIERWIWNP